MAPRLGWCAVGIALLVSGPARRAAASPAVPDLALGQVATQDVTTSVALTVVDPERTEQLRQLEALKIPPVFRFHAAAAEEVEALFRLAFTEVRHRFVAELHAKFPGHRWTPAELGAAPFQDFVSEFQRRFESFPLTAALARTWAAGEPDELWQAEWSIMLRAFMGRLLVADDLPVAAHLGPEQVCLVPASSAEAPPDLAAVERQGHLTNRTSLATLAQARQELLNGFPPGQLAVGRFLAAFLKPNCVFDEGLTRARRARRAEPVLAAAQFAPGQLLVRAGQRVDEKSKAALEQLRAYVTAARALEEQSRARVTVARLRDEAARSKSQVQLTARWNRWLASALTVSLLALLAFGWRRFSSPSQRHQLPARRADGATAVTVIACPSCSESIVLPGWGPGDAWQERALQAERRADQAATVVRAGLLPHLAGWLKSKLVRGLLWQRRQLLDVQRQAAQDVEELERRLARVQAPLAERLHAYEKRITELEQELAAKHSENRELIQAKIALARRKLAEEQGRDLRA